MDRDASVFRRPWLAFLAVALAAPPATAVERLGEAVRPIAQAIALELDPAREDYRGKVEIDLEVAREVPTIRLHARGQTIESAELRIAGAAPRPLSATAGAADIAALGDGQPIPRGAARLTIAFTQEFNTQAVALYKTLAGGEPYLFTQFEAAEARGAFPCFDEPAFKIPFRVRIRVPEGIDVVANTQIESEETAGGFRSVVFRETKPLPSYLLALAVGRFDYVEIPGMSVPGRIVTPRGQGALGRVAAAQTPAILAELERWFDSKYPYDKLDLIAVPEFWAGAMENPGAITFADDLLLPGETPTAGQLRRLIQVTAHELAHIWFGDLVTMAWWDDLWLNESFADWLGDKTTDRLRPDFGTGRAELGEIDALMTADSRPSAEPIRQPEADPEAMMQAIGLAYAKGKAVLGMVEGWLGEETFRRGVHDYLRAHAWGIAVGPDLWRALGAASGRDVAAVLPGFLEQPGIPLVAVEPIGAARLRVTQRRYATAGIELPPLAWKIPVRLRAGGGGASATVSFLLEGRATEIEVPGLETIDWVMPNADAAGYYRWRVPPALFAALSARAAEALTVRERLALLGNASALLAAGELAADEYLALLGRFGGDPDPAVAAAVVEHLDRVKEPLGEKASPAAWAGFLRATLGPALERIGRAPRAGESPETAVLRPLLIERLGHEGADPALVAWAKSAAAPLLAGEPGGLDPALAGPALELAALDGDRLLFDRYLARFDAAATPADRARWLRAFGAFRAPELTDAALGLIAAGKLRPNEIGDLLRALGASGDKSDQLLDWSIAAFPMLAKLFPPEFLAYFPYFGSGCDLARYAKAKNFFGAPERKVGGTERTLDQVEDQVRSCRALAERGGDAAARLLAPYAGR
jgi:alanyl aminopeptidase